MTSLEFIKREIKNQKETIDIAKEYIKAGILIFPAEKINKENLKCMEEQLKTLQQIKTDLEAWEVVKNKGVDMIIFMLYDGNLEKYNDYVKSSLENECDYEKCLLTQDNCEKLKKALGLDNE